MRTNEFPYIIVIIPVYNEHSTLPAVINNLVFHNFTNIIVVDDGSVDNTEKSITHKNVHYLKHKVNLGQGAALQTGIDYARKLGADIIVTFDADGQHCAEDLSTLIEPVITQRADIVFGSRFLSKGKSDIPFAKMIVLQCGRIVNYLLTGILLSDAHNGLRVFNKKAADLINITENKMAHASEILLQVKQHGLRYTEKGVYIRYSTYSKHKGQSAWNGINIFVDLLLHKILK